MLRLANRNFAKFPILSRLSSTAATATEPNSVNRENVKEPKIQQLINEDIKNNYPVPVFKRALIHNKAIALKDGHGEFTYRDLYFGSQKLSQQISDICGKKNVNLMLMLIDNDLVSFRKTNKLQSNLSLPK